MPFREGSGPMGGYIDNQPSLPGFAPSLSLSYSFAPSTVLSQASLA